MLEKSERRPYWRSTKWGMAITLVPLIGLHLASILFVDQLNSNPFLGFPLGYFMCAHGVVIFALAAVGTFMGRQHLVDHLHGAQEDS